MSMLELLERAIWSVRGRHFIGKGRLLRILSPRHGERTIRIAPGVRMRVRLDDHLQRLMYMDILHHDWLPALLRPGGVFLDVGANVGFFTLIAAGLVGASGRVIALEPIPRTFELLRANLDLNGFTQVQAERLALGAAPGTVQLHLPPPEAHRDFLVTKVPVPGWEPVAVPCATLDEAVARWQLPRIDLLKIDVEGGEPEVIRGGRSALSSGLVRALVCEFSGPYLAQAGTTAQAIIAGLDALGFSHAGLDRQGRLSPKPLPVLDPDRDCNLVFMHRDPATPGARLA
jgi:FkbM family methyltransferase